jgi:phosphopantothenoylcysteine synthetase/decarboxylase
MARICVIVAGGVRAPRGIELARRFRADGHQVRAVLTQVAHLYLLPLFFRHPIAM